MKKIISIITLIFLCGILKAQKLNVMTYNIHHGANAENVDQLDEMAKFIKASGADLVGLQEVDSVCKRSGNVDQMKRLGELTGMHFAFARHLAYDGGAYGQGILSKYPISEVQNNRITLLKKDGQKDSRALITGIITLPNQKTIVLASVHFALDVPSRLIQSDETLNFLKDYKMPVILTGDLNALPDQPEITKLNQVFTSTDRKNLLTFPEDIPVKKIDYIYVNTKSLKKVLGYKVFNEVKLSDHLAAMATLQLNYK